MLQSVRGAPLCPGAWLVCSPESRRKIHVLPSTKQTPQMQNNTALQMSIF